MSFGKMNTVFSLYSPTPTKDAEGFINPGDTILATGRAYYEPKNSTEKWRNSAVFAEASALFRFRAIPGLTVDTTMFIICNGERYNIISAEDVRGKNMYIELLGKKIEASGG